MFNELNESIEEMNYEEMEAISFKETMSLEEAVCEVIAADNMKNNTTFTSGKSPYHGDIDSLVNSLMFHNQDHIGLPEEDMQNYDPDVNIGNSTGKSAISTMSSEDDSVSLVESLLSEDNSEEDFMTEDEVGEDDDDNEDLEDSDFGDDEDDDKTLGEGLLADLLG